MQNYPISIVLIFLIHSNGTKISWGIENVLKRLIYTFENRREIIFPFSFLLLLESRRGIVGFQRHDDGVKSPRLGRINASGEKERVE